MKVSVIGGGAAGMIAAYFSAINGNEVVLIEKNEKLGKKIYITGKGRCNLTNLCEPDDFLQNVVTNPKFVYASIYGFTPQETVDFFNGLGLKTKVERGNRVFPESDKSSDVIKTLSSAILSAKVTVKLNETVKSITTFGGAVKSIITDKNEYFCDRVIVATGGLSYPSTGSTGDGYRFARQAGHTVMPPEPSLVSLVERGGVCRRMMGLSLKNVALTLYEGKKALFCEQGEMLFTHFGMSGPLVLSASAHIRDMKKYGYRVCIDLKPALPPEKLYKRVSEDFALLANREAANCLVKLLPASMQPVMLDVWGMDPQRKVNQITREERRRLVELLKAFPVELAGKGDLAHAVVTSGGVSVKEVDPKTMQSKLCPGLYFAGEVLDVDAYTGGYNLGIAFATAYAAASHL